jgi:large subunit ribosomal protein L5
MPVGAMVTLRKARMWEFYDRLINTAIPQVRDFRGMSQNCFDGHGNYTIGIREQIVFPEINIDKVAKIRGMNISIVTSAKTDEEALELLKSLNFPFKRD